jgi:hypothetical protein
VVPRDTRSLNQNMTSTLKGNRKKPPTNAATAAAAANPTLRATRQP